MEPSGIHSSPCPLYRMTHQQLPPLPPEAVTTLLARARQIQKQGNDAGARTVLRALSARAPDDTRVWAMLAVLAETREERYHALSRLVAIDPANQPAQAALARLAPAAAHRPAHPAPEPVAEPAPVTESAPESAPEPHRPVQQEPAPADRRPVLPPRYSPSESSYVMPPASLVAEQAAYPPLRRRQPRWPLFVVLGTGALIAIALIVLFPRWQRGDFAARPAATPALPGGAAASPTDAPAPSAAPTAAPTPPPSVTPVPTSAPATAVSPVETAATSAPGTESLQPGDIAQQGIWTASLLDAAYARVLDGSIGDLQPQGRFLLAMMVINNNGTTPAMLPEDFFTLIDTQGQRYRSRKVASTTFLNTFGRGQYGDLSLEEEIPAGVNVTVPVIFDVPEGVSGLQLRVGGADIGWAMPAP